MCIILELCLVVEDVDIVTISTSSTTKHKDNHINTMFIAVLEEEKDITVISFSSSYTAMNIVLI